MSALLVMPVVIGVVLTLFQIAMLWHTEQTVTAAAQAGAEQARVTNTSAQRVEGASRDIASRLGEVTVEQRVAADTVSVSVSGRGPSLIPVDALTRVSATVTLPRERVTAP